MILAAMMIVWTRNTVRHVDSALASGSRIARGAGGSGGGGMALAAFLSVFAGLVAGLVAVEPFLGRAFGAMCRSLMFLVLDEGGRIER
jgi:hypothetical protein